MSEHHIHIHLISPEEDESKPKTSSGHARRLEAENSKLEAILKKRDEVITDLETRLRETFTVAKIQRAIEQSLDIAAIPDPYKSNITKNIISKL